MLVRTPEPALVVVLGRFLQVELQPVQLTNRVESVPRLAECETELVVVGDRAGKVVDKELWSERCHPRLRLGSRHQRPRSVMRAATGPVLEHAQSYAATLHSYRMRASEPRELAATPVAHVPNAFVIF